VLVPLVAVPPADVVPPVAAGAEPPLLQPAPVIAARPRNAALKTTSFLIALPF
jgi:hypothetical protein